MSIAPDQNFVEVSRNAVLASWKAPDGLVGRVVSNLQQLRERFPADALYLEPELVERIPSGGVGNGFAIYARSLTSNPIERHKVAYGCGGCNTIIIGPPRIEAVDTGRKALDYYCVHCNAYLYGGTIGGE